MKKHDYLKKALLSGAANKLAWIISAFCITKESAEAYKDAPYPFRLINTHKHYQCIDDQGNIVDIEDSDTSAPLFRFLDPIDVDQYSGFANIKEPVSTKIGNLIFNSIAIIPAFGQHFPFQAGKLKIANMEMYIAARLVNNPKSEAEEIKLGGDGKFTVRQYLHFRDSLVYLEQFAPITSWSATRKGVTRPEGIEEFKANLIREMGGIPKDPAGFAEFEAKLLAFDSEWLKDDPAFDNFLSGKVRTVSRKKAFLAIGMPDRLDNKEPPVPIVRTLEQGQPTDPKEYAAVLNGARFGSYSRGTETINGGVVSKTIIRVASNYEIEEGDCGTLFGIRWTFGSDTIKSLVGRTIIDNGASILIEKIEQANHYLDKPVVVRSPVGCRAGAPTAEKKTAEDKLCTVCAGPALSQFKTGLSIPGTEVSHLILNQSLKAMHGKNLTTAEVDLATALT